MASLPSDLGMAHARCVTAAGCTRRGARIFFGVALALITPTAGWAATTTQPAVSTTAPQLIDYKVQPGDSCGSLAKQLYGDSHRVDLIHNNNNLGPSPHKLRPGQILKVPVRATAGPKEPDARLTFVRNQVEAYTPEYHRGQKNEALAQGNRVGTLAASSAEISFSNETQMQLGEHSMVVIFGDTPPGAGHRRAAGEEQASLLKGTLRAHLAELSGPADPKRPPLVVATPGASVELPRQSGEVHLEVDPQKTTRLSVLRGRSQLAAAGRKVEVPEGFGSRANKGQAPTPPRPLPRAPSWAPMPSRLQLVQGAALPAAWIYRAEVGAGPPATAWHRQLARDANFNDLIIDTQVAADVLSWSLENLPAGELYARISAVDADRFEGQASAVVHTQVARVVLIPATTTARAQAVFPRGLLCGLDGGPLTAAEKGELVPGHSHQVRCALQADSQSGEIAELTIPAVDCGAVPPPPPEPEPPPADSIPLAPPRLQPIPPPPGEPRVYFDLAAAGSLLFNRQVYGLGGGGELGPRIRLPFGSLRIALRILAEQAITPSSSPVMLNLGGVVTYVVGPPAWRVNPYFGLWTQGILQRTAATLGTRGVRNNTGLVLGGLVGAQVRVAHGGIFAELGYRGTLSEQLAVQAPEWNSGFLLLGYRLSL